MKIEAIRGKNLASLEGEFAIDFTAEPLKSAGIFAITGNTGSGKSTLLDALCLALFDNTPRVSHVTENSIAILDVRDKTINQKDSRAILRRGTAEGYAEVDFISLSGEKLRSTWSVKRARNKPDGSLQSSEIRLMNLSSGVEIQGTKTEVLAKITGLISLTFDQFTRAVLLAQGDFATFLKAKQPEKAELLEKLTGTEIYSRISAMIYEKTKNAEQDVNILKERMQGIELLTDEQTEALESEKKMLQENLSNIKTVINTLSEKIKWIQDEENFRKSVEQAEKTLTGIQYAVSEAKPRYDYLARIESVQEIRDDFIELQTGLKQLTSNKIHLKKQEAELENTSNVLLQANENLSSVEKEQLVLEQQIEKFEPEINKARELDVRITGIKTNADEALQELQAVQAAEERIGRTLQLLAKEMEESKSMVAAISGWFERHRIYQDIIPKTDLIVSMMQDIVTAKEQGGNNLGIIEKNEVILENELKKFAALQQEAERLNTLLPAEIMILREKLEPEKPCPVCGSLEHPAQNIKSEESLQEKELIRAKQAIATETAQLSDSIDKRKVEIARLKALVENYMEQAVETTARVEGYLSILPSWKEEFEKNTLQTKLTEIAREWQKNTEYLANAEKVINHKNSSLQNEQQNFVEAKNSVGLKQKKSSELLAKLEELKMQRAGILKGKPVEDAVRYFNGKKKELAEKLKTSTDNRNSIVSKQETLKGIIRQIQDEITRLSGRCDLLKTSVENWVAQKEGFVTQEQLSELLTKDKQWLDAEKQFLNDLKEQEITAKATLEERNGNLLKHRQRKLQPENEEEPKELLSEKLLEYNSRNEQYIKRIAEIEIVFSNHRKGQERMKAFEKDFAEKNSLCENWKKLNDLLGSATGLKFKEIAQGYTLDVLLLYANKHLQELSKRYELQRIPDTLALQVADLDMLGEIRTVHSLSGGESFLISLALALGLSSLSSNRMKIESLFIDEGFGSLDIDTLRIAMDALERLQTQGRKIGVISHVAEMTERIAVQIRVVKTVNGKSRVEVV